MPLEGGCDPRGHFGIRNFRRDLPGAGKLLCRNPRAIWPCRPAESAAFGDGKRLCNNLLLSAYRIMRRVGYILPRDSANPTASYACGFGCPNTIDCGHPPQACPLMRLNGFWTG